MPLLLQYVLILLKVVVLPMRIDVVFILQEFRTEKAVKDAKPSGVLK